MNRGDKMQKTVRCSRAQQQRQPRWRNRSPASASMPLHTAVQSPLFIRAWLKRRTMCSSKQASLGFLSTRRVHRSTQVKPSCQTPRQCMQSFDIQGMRFMSPQTPSVELYVTRNECVHHLVTYYDLLRESIKHCPTPLFHQKFGFKICVKACLHCQS